MARVMGSHGRLVDGRFSTWQGGDYRCGDRESSARVLADKPEIPVIQTSTTDGVGAE